MSCLFDEAVFPLSLAKANKLPDPAAIAPAAAPSPTNPLRDVYFPPCHPPFDRTVTSPDHPKRRKRSPWCLAASRAIRPVRSVRASHPYNRACSRMPDLGAARGCGRQFTFGHHARRLWEAHGRLMAPGECLRPEFEPTGTRFSWGQTIGTTPLLRASAKKYDLHIRVEWADGCRVSSPIEASCFHMS